MFTFTFGYLRKILFTLLNILICGQKFFFLISKQFYVYVLSRNGICKHQTNGCFPHLKAGRQNNAWRFYTFYCFTLLNRREMVKMREEKINLFIMILAQTTQSQLSYQLSISDTSALFLQTPNHLSNLHSDQQIHSSQLLLSRLFGPFFKHTKLHLPVKL